MNSVNIIVRFKKSIMIHEIGSEKVIFGRAEHASVTLPDPSCSGQHCQLYLKDGFLMIQDLESKNGTFINNHRKELQQKLYIDDIIQIGDCYLSIDTSNLSLIQKQKWRNPEKIGQNSKDVSMLAEQENGYEITISRKEGRRSVASNQYHQKSRNKKGA